jgi:hypothetical protein
MSIKDFDKDTLSGNNDLSNIDLAKEFPLASETDASGNYIANIANKQNTSLGEFYRGGQTTIPQSQNIVTSTRVTTGEGLTLSEIDPTRGPIPTRTNAPQHSFEQGFNSIPIELTYSTDNQYDDITSPDQFPGVLQHLPKNVIYRDTTHNAPEYTAVAAWQSAGWAWDTASPGVTSLPFANPAGFTISAGGLPFIRDGVTAIGSEGVVFIDGAVSSQSATIEGHTLFKVGYGGVLSGDTKRNPSGNTATWNSGNKNNNYMEFGFAGGGSVFSQPPETLEQYLPSPLPDFLTIFDDHGGEEVFRFDDATQDYFENTSFYPFGASNNVTSYIWPNLTDEFMERFTLANNNNKPPVITYTAKQDENLVEKVYSNKEIKAPNSSHSGATPGPNDRLQFGSAIAVSDEGDTMVVGAGGNPSSTALGGNNIAGRIHIYERGGANSDFVRVKTLTDPSFSSNKNTGFGGRLDEMSQGLEDIRDLTATPIAISGDYIMVGASGDSNGGKVHIYRKISGTWTFSQTLVSATGTHGLGNQFHPNGIQFGESVAAHGIYLVVGSRNYKYTGRVFVYKRTGTTYALFQTIVAPFGEGTASATYNRPGTSGGEYPGHPSIASGTPYNYWNGNRGFGYSIDISGDYIAISAPGTDHQTSPVGRIKFEDDRDLNENGTRYLQSIRGSVYVYKLNAGNTGFALQQTLNLPSSEYQGIKKIYDDLKQNSGYIEDLGGWATSATTPRRPRTLVNNTSPEHRVVSELLDRCLPDVYGLKVQIRCDQTYINSESPSSKGVVFIGRNDYNIKVPEVENTMSDGHGHGGPYPSTIPVQPLANGYIGGGFFPGAGSIDVWTLDSAETEWTRQDKIVSKLETEEINFLKNLGTIGLMTTIKTVVPMSGADEGSARRQFGYNFDVSPNAQYLTAVKLSDENKAFYVNEYPLLSDIGRIPIARRNTPGGGYSSSPNYPHINYTEYNRVTENSALAEELNIWGQPITATSGTSIVDKQNSGEPLNVFHSIASSNVSHFRSPPPEVFRFKDILEDSNSRTTSSDPYNSGAVWSSLGNVGQPKYDPIEFIELNKQATHEILPQWVSSFAGNYTLSKPISKHIASDNNGNDVTGKLPGLGTNALVIRSFQSDDHIIYACPNTGESRATGQFLQQRPSMNSGIFISNDDLQNQQNAVYEFKESVESSNQLNEIKTDNFYGTSNSGLTTAFTVGSKSSTYASTANHPELLNQPYNAYSYGGWGGIGGYYGYAYFESYRDIPEQNRTYSSGQLTYYGFDAGDAKGSYYKNYDQGTLTAWGRTQDLGNNGTYNARYSFLIYSHYRYELGATSQPYLYVGVEDTEINRAGLNVNAYGRVTYSLNAGDFFNINGVIYNVTGVQGRGGPDALNGGHPENPIQYYKIQVDKNIDYSGSNATRPLPGERVYVSRPTESVTNVAGADMWGRLPPPGATLISNQPEQVYNNTINPEYGRPVGKFQDKSTNAFLDNDRNPMTSTVRDVTEKFDTTDSIGALNSTSFIDASGKTQTIVMLIEVVHSSAIDKRNVIPDDFPFVQARGRSGPKGEWFINDGARTYFNNFAPEVTAERAEAEKTAWTGITLSLAGIKVENSDNTFKEITITKGGNSVTLLRSNAVYNSRFNGSSHWTWPEPTPRKRQAGHTGHANYQSILNSTGTATLKIK